MKHIATTLMFFLLIASAKAQYVDLVWEAHNIGFSAPGNFEVLADNENEFSAGNDELQFSILPLQDPNINYDDLAEAVIQVAEELEYDVVSEVGILELSGLTGYYLVGDKDGANAIIIALLDESSETNLMVVIAYSEDMHDDAVDIASSIYVID